MNNIFQKYIYNINNYINITTIINYNNTYIKA